MNDSAAKLEHALALALDLPPVDRVKLVEQIMVALAQELAGQEKKPKHSLYGLLADLGPAPSAEDIDEARREMYRKA